MSQGELYQIYTETRHLCAHNETLRNDPPYVSDMHPSRRANKFTNPQISVYRESPIDATVAINVRHTQPVAVYVAFCDTGKTLQHSADDGINDELGNLWRRTNINMALATANGSNEDRPVHEAYENTMLSADPVLVRNVTVIKAKGAVYDYLKKNRNFMQNARPLVQQYDSRGENVETYRLEYPKIDILLVPIDHTRFHRADASVDVLVKELVSKLSDVQYPALVLGLNYYPHISDAVRCAVFAKLCQYLAGPFGEIHFAFDEQNFHQPIAKMLQNKLATQHQ